MVQYLKVPMYAVSLFCLSSYRICHMNGQPHRLEKEYSIDFKQQSPQQQQSQDTVRDTGYNIVRDTRYKALLKFNVLRFTGSLVPPL